MAVVGVLAAVFAYLCIPGHPLGTFFYNAAPPLFRSTIGYLHGTSAIGQQNGAEVWTDIVNHVQVTLLAVAIDFAVCVPLGIIGSRFALPRALAANIIGIARGVPGIAVLFLMFPWLGTGERPVLVALLILGAPPIFLNTVAGYAGVDAAIVEAARGMGMSWKQILLRIETPLAAPVVVAGVRTATVELIASATIAEYLNFHTLGEQIFNGLVIQTTTLGQDQLAVGIFCVAALALLAELLLATVQRALTPAPMRSAR
jgi:osmoprotectant transport system permease protein